MLTALVRAALALTVLALAARAATLPHALRLALPLPAMQEFPSDGAREVLAEYHMPVGVPEAARIAAAEAAAPPALRVAGGLASRLGQHPCMAGLLVSLTSGETSVCGGALVSSARVLTAAACYWDGRSQAAAVLAVLGSLTLFSGGERVSATAVTVHPAYTPATLHYNLALLTIPHQVTTEYVKPIALSHAGDYVGYSAEVVGYGRTSDSEGITAATRQRHVSVSVISNSECQHYYGGVLSAGECCTSGAGGRGPCAGDHGGPLLLHSPGDPLLLGVFTLAPAAGCTAGAPAVYQRVAYHYHWITSQL